MGATSEALKARGWRVPPPAKKTEVGDRMTDRQVDALGAIVDIIEKTGLPPTVRELMVAMNIGSPNGVMCHLKALKAKGIIAWDANHARSIRLVGGETCACCGGLGRVFDGEEAP